MPLVARGHVTYLILNYWTQPTNPKTEIALHKKVILSSAILW